MYFGGFKQNLYPARTAFQAHPLFASTFGLVSLWRFEDGTNLGADTYGTNNLTNNNAATQAVPGKVGNGLTLVKTSSQSLSIADNASLQVGTGDFWLSAWVNLASEDLFVKPVVTKQTGAGGATWEYVLRISGNGGGSSVPQFVTRSGAGTTTQNGAAIVAGSWYFFFCFFNKSTGLKYIVVNNNTPVTNGNTAAMVVSTQTFRIGVDSPGNYFDGSIDEVALGKLSTGSLGNGSYGTLAYTISQTLYNNGNGLAWPW